MIRFSGLGLVNFFTTSPIDSAHGLSRIASEPSMPPEPPPSGPKLRTGLMVAGSEMSGFTITGVLLDVACGTLPWITIALTVLGLVVGFYHLTRFAKALGGKSS